jgi:predicted neuraminidase
MVFDNSGVDRSDPKVEGELRKPLTVAISENEGLTWRYVRDLEVGRKGMGMAELQIKVPGREEYSFPTICQLEDGTILVAYNYRRQTIKVVAFRENWVHGGGTVGRFQGRTAITTPSSLHSP